MWMTEINNINHYHLSNFYVQQQWRADNVAQFCCLLTYSRKVYRNSSNNHISLLMILNFSPSLGVLWLKVYIHQPISCKLHDSQSTYLLPLPPMKNLLVHKKQMQKDLVFFYCLWSNGLEDIFAILKGISTLISDSLTSGKDNHSRYPLVPQKYYAPKAVVHLSSLLKRQLSDLLLVVAPFTQTLGSGPCLFSQNPVFLKSVMHGPHTSFKM